MSATRCHPRELITGLGCHVASVALPTSRFCVQLLWRSGGRRVGARLDAALKCTLCVLCVYVWMWWLTGCLLCEYAFSSSVKQRNVLSEWMEMRRDSFSCLVERVVCAACGRRDPGSRATVVLVVECCLPFNCVGKNLLRGRGPAVCRRDGSSRLFFFLVSFCIPLPDAE